MPGLERNGAGGEHARNAVGACRYPKLSGHPLYDPPGIRGDTATAFQTSGTGAIELNHVFVYGGTGSVGFTGNPPLWSAPTEGLAS